MALFDQTQLIRIITNLVTNSNQALAETKNPKIDIEVKEENEKSSSAFPIMEKELKKKIKI
jgi:C4-dicarboxylate-specific signal transduction histidine kinase